MTSGVWILLGYCAALAGFGAWLGRRVSAADTFFVAGRRLRALPLFATVLAANIGAGTTVGAAGLGYRDGLSAWWWVGSAGLGTVLLAVWIGPRIWVVAKRRGLLTVGDFLDLRYGRSVRLLIASLLWLATLTIVAGQLIAMAEILAVVGGAPRWLGAAAGGTVVICYFAAGGLFGSAWVNLVQLGVLIAGFAVALPIAISGAGGWEAMLATSPKGAPDYWNFLSGGGSGWLYAPLLIPAFLVSPGLLQKAYGAKDERAVRRGLLAAGLGLMMFAAVPVLLGIAARAYEPALANHEQALPVVFTAALPPAAALLGLAAVFSAEVSSADAGLFMLSTSLSRDLYKGWLRPDASDAQVLRMARLAAVAGGVIAVFLALVLTTVIASLTIFYAVLSVTLFVPLVAGLHLKKVGRPEGVAAVLAGLLALPAFQLALPGVQSPLLNGTAVGLAASGAAFIGWRLIARRRGLQG